MNQRGIWQLILMAQEGDRQAVDALFFMSFRPAYLVLQAIVPDRDAALQILSEGYVHIFRSLEDLEQDSSFTSALNGFNIARAAELYPDRRIVFGEDYATKFSSFSAQDCRICDFDTLRSLDLSACADEILAVFEALPPEQKVSAYLFYYASCLPEEIADVLSADEKSVCGALAQMRKTALPQIGTVLQKEKAFRCIGAESAVPWALRNTVAYVPDKESLDAFYQDVLQKLVDNNVLDTTLSVSEPIDEPIEMEIKDIKPPKDFTLLHKIFSVKTLLILLFILLAAGIAIGVHRLQEYKSKVFGWETSNRTTIRLTTTSLPSEYYIYSTEYTMPTETETTTEKASETQTEAVATTERPTESTTANPYADFAYSENGGSITITGYSGSKTSVEVPKSIHGKPVTTIGENAFFNTGITSIKLPSSLRTIGKNAFHSCVGLTAITIPNGVTLIDNAAFRGCSNLKNITLADTLQKIGNQAFYQCTSLSGIHFGDKLTYIGDWAFAYCTSLPNVAIVGSVNHVGSNVFYECKSLTACTFESSSKVTALGEAMFFDCISLKTFSFPSGVKVVPANCFMGCRSLSSVAMHANMTSIGANAFADCISLSAVKLSAKLLHLEKGAFSGCTTLKEIEIPSGALDIGDNAFSGCSNLQKAVIPASVTSIGSKAFAGCDDLVITCPANSAAEKYAIANQIEIYGRSSETTYKDDSSKL